MLPVNIDISGFIEQSTLSPGDVQTFTGLLLDRLEHDFMREWEHEVVNTLHQTRPEYLRAMFTERVGDNTVVFGVSARASQLAVALELGKEPFDEKIGFSKSPKRTMKKDGVGWYLTIPFRAGIPTTIGECPVFSGFLPALVYRIAKKQTTPVAKSQLPAYLQQPGKRAAIRVGDKIIPQYIHKSPRWEGLKRIVDIRESRGQYFTFRRVSDKSDQNAFWHPGFKSYGFLNKALEKTNIGDAIRRTRIEFFATLNS